MSDAEPDHEPIIEEPISPEFRQRLIAAVERPLRVRREILLLAAHASGHLCGPGHACRVCHRDWPCEDVHKAARSALEAFADTADDPHALVSPSTADTTNEGAE